MPDFIEKHVPRRFVLHKGMVAAFQHHKVSVLNSSRKLPALIERMNTIISCVNDKCWNAYQDKAASSSQRQAEWLHKPSGSTYRQPDNAWYNLFRLFGMQPLDIFGGTVSKRPALFGELQGFGVLFCKSPKRRAALDSAAQLNQYPFMGLDEVVL